GDILIADFLLNQMLQALDYPTYKHLICQNVKSANILYLTFPKSHYHFYLADFGICNVASHATTVIDPPMFIAPERVCNAGQQQLHE
ncbi:hypothetical protein LOZ29_006634, partial [Ophidiomyces ophidiicola]